MRINDASAKHLSLYHDALFWAGASPTEYPFDPDFLRNANLALDAVSAAIMRFDNTWEWDDPNHTNGADDPDMPIATANLVSGQDNYPLSLTHLKIIRVRVKDSNGNWVTLKPKSRRELTDSDLAASGTPSSYDLFGSRLFLNAPSNYASTGGIEIQFQRGADYFGTTDTTREPGFAPPFHRLISLLPALDFAEAKGRATKIKTIRDRIGYVPEGGQAGAGLFGALAEFYSTRAYDQDPKITLEKSARARGLMT